MSLTTRMGLLAGAAALTVTGVGAAAATEPNTNEEWRAHVEKLTARVAELEGRQNDRWLNEQRAAEVRGLVQDVLADADTRASLLGSGMAAGYDNGFTVGSADGNFFLRMNGQLQSRWIWSYQSEGPGGFLMEAPIGVNEGVDFGNPDAGDRHRSGFEVSRAKLWFTGHVIDPSWQYVIETDLSRFGDGFTLLDAYISHDYGTGVEVTFGQFRLPFLREQMVDSRYQQAVERSLVHQYFTTGRSQGLQVAIDMEMFRLFGAFSDGANQSNTSWADRTTEFAFTARGEALLGGTFGQFNEFRSEPGEEMGILVGAAAHWERGEYGTADDITELFRGTIDASLKMGGWNLFGAYIFNHADLRDVGGNWQDHAIVGQGGFEFIDGWEVFGRYEHVWFDSDRPVGNLSVLTAGVNHYFAGHQAKWTTDFGYGFKSVDLGNTTTGWRSDWEPGPDGGDDGQFVVRTQLQLLF